ITTVPIAVMENRGILWATLARALAACLCILTIRQASAGEPIGACCTPPNFERGETCLDTTEQACLSILDDDGNPAVWHDDLLCDDPGFFCIQWVCRVAEEDCANTHDSPGCSDQECCANVCDVDPFCCGVTWDQFCLALRNTPLPGCWAASPVTNTCDNRTVVSFDEGTCLDRTRADCTGNQECLDGVCDTPFRLVSTDSQQAPYRAFCCLEPGQLGATRYIRFQPTAESVRITAVPHTEDDAEAMAILQVHLGDSGTNECDDDFTLQCNTGEIGQPAELNLHGLEVGRDYYLQYAQRNTARPSLFRMYFEYPSPLPPVQSPPNDTPEGAFIELQPRQLIEFDTTQATYNCPRENCLTSPISPFVESVEADLFYYYIQPAFQGTRIQICTDTETAVVAYLTQIFNDTPLSRIKCSLIEADDCSTNFELPAASNVDQLLTIRVGGIRGSRPIGTITVEEVYEDCQLNGTPDAEDIQSGKSEDIDNNGVPDECEACILFSDPPHEAVDARQPSEPAGTMTAGWRSVDLSTLESCPALAGVSPSSFITESTNATAPPVVGIFAFFDTVILSLAEAIPPGSWTTITLTDGPASVRLGFLPGDTNGDRTSDGNDIRQLIDWLDGPAPPTPEKYDMNRNGQLEPEDLLRLIDLLNGADAYESWFSRELP
ncbi:MAG: hypothetical protein ACPGXK_15095, partial [Phycisphaerae bacterium]